jgi:3-phenylpropionate/trans-cinnamate dioxygenase ferredoxin reductase subunit
MRICVVGGGVAAASAVEELRAQGYDDELAVFGAEAHLPYHRPPLSKEVLLGTKDPDSTWVHDGAWYEQHRVDVRLGEPVLDIDRTGAALVTATGRHGFDRLLVATGAEPRRLALADASGATVAYLRTLDEARTLRDCLRPGRRIVVIGAGWIGLEVAAAARTAGCEVTVIEALDLPLVRVLGERVAAVFADLHRAHGVDLRLGAGVSTIEGGRDHVRLGMEDGDVVEGELLVVGVGVRPRVDLARRAGIAVDDGILTDAALRTDDPRIHAAGDVANHLHQVLGRRVRVEHWDTAVEQGRAAARTMLGADEPYTRLPYFFTDQYDLGMEYVGSVGPDGFDDVVLRGDPSAGAFAAFWLRGGRVLAGMHVNDWDAIGPIRDLVGASPAPTALGDPRIPLEELAGSVG